jgi:alkylation response protein AidB-like acyl-CoA dehydrogenase
MMQASLDETLGFLANRQVGSRALGSLHGIQMQVADLFIEVESSRALIERASREGGNIALRFGTKVNTVDAATRVIDRCLLLHGNAGYSQAMPFERRARDIRAFAIHYGNNDVVRGNLGQMLLAGSARS